MAEEKDDGVPSIAPVTLETLSSHSTPPPRSADQSALTMPGGPSPATRTISGVVDPLLGTVLDDRYRIIRRLGTGGMATVYLAEHMFIGRKVALKVLHPQLAVDDNFVRRFLNEGRAAGTLGHPNIIASTDMGTTPLGQPYLVLEYLEGKDLAQVIDRDGALPPVRAARIAVQVASALSAAHQARIVHRDLKAENIFLLNRNDRRDEVRVIDFGISKFGSTHSTQAGLLIGTPQYMAPEQLSNPSEVDERADIYALGVILFQMLTGRLPFNDPTIPGLVTRIANEVPPDLTDKVPGLPQAFAKLVALALAKDPSNRPESMAAFEETLARFANLGSPSLETPVVVLPPPAPVKEAPKKKAPVVAIAAIAAVTVLVLAAFAFKPWQSAPATDVAVAPSEQPAPVAAAPKPSPVVGAVAAAAVAEPVAVPAVVTVTISSPVKKARVAFRGRVFPLPYRAEVKSGTSPESIEVTAPGHSGRRYWVTFDQTFELNAPLNKGSGVVDASDTETAVALGNAPADLLDGESVARRVRRAPVEEKEKEVLPAVMEPAAEPMKALEPVAVAAVAPPAPEPEKKFEEAPAPAPVVAEKPKNEVPTLNPMDSPELRNAINGQMSQLRPCSEAARKDNPNFSGNVTLTIELNGDGTLSTASANTGSGQGKFAACLIKTVRKWTLPKPPGEQKTRLVFPLFLG